MFVSAYLSKLNIKVAYEKHQSILPIDGSYRICPTYNTIDYPHDNGTVSFN